MKPAVVLAVRSDSFSGVERYICDVATGLDARGWPVTVVGGDEATMTAQLPAGVHYRPATTTWQVTRCLARLRGAALVHAHMSAAELAAVLSGLRTRARVVATRHFARARGSHPVTRLALQRVARRLDREVAISRFVADASGGNADVILNGTPQQPPAVDHDARQVLVMQRLEPEKDTATALRAWAASGIGAEGWRLVIAGRGREEGELRRLAAELKMSDQVRFAGFVADPQRLRSISSLFLATAPAEPFGLAVVEAMAAGMPVLAADGGAHRETVAETGQLFTPRDPQSCAALLRSLAEDPAGRRALGETARHRHHESLSIDRHLDRLEDLYREVLG